ncbi:MAG: hypothetical protein R3B93_12535 [Bacteroidia bacterium]
MIPGPGAAEGFMDYGQRFHFFHQEKSLANRHDGLYIFTFDSTSASRIYGVAGKIPSMDHPLPQQVVINGDTLISNFKEK